MDLYFAYKQVDNISLQLCQKIFQSVEDLTTVVSGQSGQIQIQSGQIQSLLDTRNVSKGFVIALPFIGGGIGAGAGKLFEWIHKALS